ncbi:hypothetical protein V1281_006808 [Nitrobacteraceae bacterium AZCC 2161]
MSETLLKRRTFVQGMGLAAMAAAGLRVPQAHAQQQVPWSAGTELPKCLSEEFLNHMNHL